MPTTLPVVAVDAMGGDAAPGPEVEGAVAAARDELARVVLVGDREKLTGLVARQPGGAALVEAGALRLQHASEVISMHDHAGQAARSKKDSSMRVCFELAQRGDADAVVSAGNSGAMLALGLFVFRRQSGVDRPAIVTTFPTKTGACALLDMGANVECRAEMLAQFAALGATYARLAHRKSQPRVGLLSNGSEEHKGTDLTRAAHALLSSGACELGFQYLGYVEGSDIFDGHLDVVVTDGFTGNVLLKTAEGAGQVIFQLLKQEILASQLGKLGALLLKDSFARLKRVLDYDEYGGAPLVGVNGVAVICHGRSNAKALKNGIRVAAHLAADGMVAAMGRALELHAPLWGTANLAAPTSGQG